VAGRAHGMSRAHHAPPLVSGPPPGGGTGRACLHRRQDRRAAAHRPRRADGASRPGVGRARHPAGNSRWLPPVDAGTGGGRESPARSVLKKRSLEQTVSLPPLVEPAAELTVDEVRRYSRHLIIPDVGMTGQKRLKNAKVLVVGAGGLGSPALLYLAAAGVGTLGIADFDVVDESTLQRQIIHGQSDIGKPKAVSAKESIQEANPFVEVVLHEERLDSTKVFDIFEADGLAD